MSELSAGLQSALAADRVTLFGAAEIVLPTGTLRLLDGSGEVAIGGQVFTGRDAAWGTLDTVRGIADSDGDTAPRVTLGIIPASDTALSALLDPALQGSPVTLMIGAIDPASGTVLGTAYVAFVGELDVATVKWGENDRRVDFTVNSIGERLFAIEEGRRLSDTFHQTVWPGELGLEFVTGVDAWVPWGQALNTAGVQVRSDEGRNPATGRYAARRMLEAL